MIRKTLPLAKLLSERRPDFCYYKSYLFLKNYNLFLRGFALDMPLGGCYIWKYMFPLFSDAEFINLTFGYRLEGYVDFAGASYSKILDSVLLITDNNSDFSRTEDINEFFLFVKDSRISRESRKAAMALIEKYYGLGQDQITRIVEVNKKIYLLA